jgi:hypothetical protein
LNLFADEVVCCGFIRHMLERIDGMLAPVIVVESAWTLSHEELFEVWKAVFIKLNMCVNLHFLTVCKKDTVAGGGRVVANEDARLSPVTCVRSVGCLAGVSKSQVAERGQL